MESNRSHRDCEKPSKCQTDCQLRQEINELRELVTKQASALNKLLSSQDRGGGSGTLRPCMCNVPDICDARTVKVSNPYIKQIKPDILHHLGLDTETTDFIEQFNDVKIVVLSNSADSMSYFSGHLAKGLNTESQTIVSFEGSGSLYTMHKSGPVLCVSHGMGAPTMSTLMNELVKLVYHACCVDPVFLRIGSSDGIAVQPGSVIVSEEVLDSQLRNSFEQVMQGTPRQLPTKLNAELVEELKSMSRPEDGFLVESGKTYSTDDYYEGQSRMNGAFVDYTDEDRENFMKRLDEQGVRNIEMESAAFAALTLQAEIRSAIVCVTNTDRLASDTVTACEDDVLNWQNRPALLVSRYICRTLNQMTSPDKKCCAMPSCCNKQCSNSEG